MTTALICALLWPVLALGRPESGQEPAQAAAPSPPARTDQLAIRSEEAKEMAAAIGAVPLIARYSTLSETARCSGDPAERVDALTLRQGVMEAILNASLETDHVLGDIDNELMQIRMVREALQSRQDRFSKISNVAAIVTGGVLGVVGTSLQFNDSTTKAGNVVLIAGGGSAAVLSLLGIRQLHGGGRLPADVPNMLAEPLAGRNAGATYGNYSAETPAVWRYLNSVPPPGTAAEAVHQTRLQKLNAEWINRGLVKDDGTGNRGNRVEELASSGVGQPVLSVDVLDARKVMLIDMYALVSTMKHSISRLERETREMFACSGK